MEFTFATNDPTIAARIIELFNPVQPRPQLSGPPQPVAAAPQPSVSPAAAPATTQADRIARGLLSRPLPPRQVALLRLLYETPYPGWVSSTNEADYLRQAGLVADNENAGDLVKAAIASIGVRMTGEFGQLRSPSTVIIKVRWDGGRAAHQLTSDGRKAIAQVAEQIFA